MAPTQKATVASHAKSPLGPWTMSTDTMTSRPPAGAAAAWAASTWNCRPPTRRWPLKAWRSR
eukprot:10253163-Lingulodinium_polyedra.AAC.1